MSERAHPLRPLPVDVKPTGQGDETAFHARIDATPGWTPYYRKWVRSWDSPTLDTLTVRDSYTLARGNAVEFYWQTQLPVQQQGQRFVIQGDAGQVTVEAPADCTLRVERLSLAQGQSHWRMAIRKTGPQGILDVKVRLRSTPRKLIQQTNQP
jgi:hypothetical protein